MSDQQRWFSGLGIQGSPAKGPNCRQQVSWRMDQRSQKGLKRSVSGKKMKKWVKQT
jgi:hypothetical protein